MDSTSRPHNLRCWLSASGSLGRKLVAMICFADGHGRLFGMSHEPSLVPIWQELIIPVLRVLSESEPRQRRDVFAAVADMEHNFYDIHCLFQNEQVTCTLEALEALGHEDTSALADDIEYQSAAVGFLSTPRPVTGYAQSPAFARAHPASAAIEAGYDAAQTLIYGDAISLDGTIETVRHQSGLL